MFRSQIDETNWETGHAPGFSDIPGANEPNSGRAPTKKQRKNSSPFSHPLTRSYPYDRDRPTRCVHGHRRFTPSNALVLLSYQRADLTLR